MTSKKTSKHFWQSPKSLFESDEVVAICGFQFTSGVQSAMTTKIGNVTCHACLKKLKEQKLLVS